MDIAREDWLLVFIVAAAVLPLGWSAMTGGGGFTPETELERECVSHAAAVEANATVANQIKDCRCIPPDRVDERQFSTPQKVKDASKLFLIQCNFDSGRTMTFPVWRVRDNYTGDLNQTNASVLKDNPG